MNNYGIKTLPNTAGAVAVATFWGQLWNVVIVAAVVILIVAAIRYFWRRGKNLDK